MIEGHRERKREERGERGRESESESEYERGVERELNRALCVKVGPVTVRCWLHECERRAERERRCTLTEALLITRALL